MFLAHANIRMEHVLNHMNFAEKTREVLVRLLISAAREERAATAARVGSDSVRVGRVSYDRSSMCPTRLSLFSAAIFQ
jgi:hypothetical protein